MITAISSTYTSFSRWSGSENAETKGSDNSSLEKTSSSGNTVTSVTSESSDASESDLRSEQRVGASSSTAQIELDTQEQQLVQELSARDREVRAHEQAHQNAGGSLTGAVSYTYEKGPDGQLYATGGEVSVQMPGSSGDPQRDIEMARQVAAAALAPANPSAQDRRVAQAAQQVAIDAQAELAALDPQESENPLAGVESADQGSTGQVADGATASVSVQASEQSVGSSDLSALEVDTVETASERNDALGARLGEYFDTIEQQGEVRSQRLAEYQDSQDELSQRLREFNQKLVDMGVLDPDYLVGAVINDQA